MSHPFVKPANGSVRSTLLGKCASLGACVILAAGALCTTVAKGQTNAGAPSGEMASKPTATPAVKRAPSKPLWRELTTRQQRALEPLAPHWDDLTEPHKRKWLAISRNYAILPPADQETLHSRMTEWATLSNQERSEARHNFAEVKRVPIDERKAKWEEYQALSEEEKRKLASRASLRPLGAAATIQPVPAQKLAPLPSVAAAGGQHTPRIQLAPPSSAAVFPPVSAEAQVPSPSTAPALELSGSTNPPVRVTEQPSSAP
jgi:Protein of unknown function (DUF3106)